MNVKFCLHLINYDIEADVHDIGSVCHVDLGEDNYNQHCRFELDARQIKNESDKAVIN